MKSFPWKQLLQQHPIFSTVRDERRIDALLADDVSWERVYAKDEVIVSQDEIGDSLFVIGSGSAEALLEVGEGPPIPLSKMRKGEVFGEMAFFEQRPRAATVRATEPCTILEIRGSDFQNLVDEYPDIEFRLLLKMSERLRHTNERILALHLKTVDEKLKLFNDRLDTEQRVVEASLKAAQAVFDQTKLRTDEVINSAERSRDRLNKSATVVGAFVSILVTLLGLFGWKEVSEMADYAKKARETQENMQKQLEGARTSAQLAETVKKEMGTQLGEVNEILVNAKQKSGEVENLRNEAKGLLDSVAPLRDGLIALYRPRFFDALGRGSALDAIAAYRQIREAGGLNKELSLFLGEMERQVVAKAQRPRSDPERSSVSDFVNLFQQAVVDAQKVKVVDAQKKRRDTLDAYYLLLVYAYLTYQFDFEQQHEEPYRGFAKRQDALAALEQYSKSTPKETPPRAASAELAKRLSREADKDVLLNLSRLAFVKVGSD